jgi:uncharacterized protein YozE (UPF0346 family)
MQIKKTCCFLITLLLFSGLVYSVDASTTTASFRGGGVTIDLTFPEEAHSNIAITHNATITANTDLSSINIGVLVYAPVNSNLQLIKNQPLSWGTLYENQSLPTTQIPILLPKQAKGTLYCIITVQTDQTTDTLSYKFYTTRVSELTFSEMQTLYNEILANYNSLHADYEALLGEYDGLWANYTSLLANYTALLSAHDSLINEYNEILANYNSLQGDYEALLGEYDGLWANYTSLLANYTALLSAHDSLINEYNSQVSTYEALLANYNELSNDYDTLNANYNARTSDLGDLQTNYNELNTTRYDLQASYNTLQTVYTALNQTYTELKNNLESLQRDFNTSEGIVGADRVVMFIFIVTLAALIVFIVYIKRNKQEPYLVIRKETVNVNDEGS